jgi:hypothetical protein
MTQSLTEAQLLEDWMDLDAYIDLGQRVYTEMINSEKFKTSPDPIFIAIQVYEMSENLWLHVEASLKRIGRGVHDFGFTRFVISDENLIDFSLDRWNELKGKL